MDSLAEEIGKPPYWITALTSVHQHGLDLLQQIQSGAAVDIPTATQTIDKLEALASTCFNAYDNEFILFGTGSDASLGSLMTTIWELKRAVFSQRTTPLSEVSNVCPCCAWALRRVGNGIVASARGGCDLCRYLKDGMEKKGVDLNPLRPRSENTKVGVWIEFRYVPRKASGNDVRPVLTHALEYGSVFLSTTSPWYSTPVWQFMVESGNKQVADELQIFSPPQQEPWSAPNISFTQSILNAAQPATTKFKPTRLLSLPPSPNSAIKLTTTTHLPHPVQYAALSYCWGPPSDAIQQTTLTTSSLPSRMTSIPLSDLSPVMLDAVKVCRSLGIPYLWIDALCIIQDSKTDWEFESQQMARIYEHSYLTICAASSSSCLEGFLSKRVVYPEYRYTSPAKGIVNGVFTLRSVPSNSDETLAAKASSPPLEQDLSVTSWSERGWVFQERAMSTSKLFFGKSMLHVQTNSLVLSENGHQSEVKANNNHDDGNTSPNTTPLSLLPPLLLHDDKTNNPYDLWLSVVLKFVHLKWTIEEDLLPGLSGPASRFNDIMPPNDAYLAGHWRSDLHASLLWVAGRRGHHPRPNTLPSLLQSLQKGNPLHCPSWSWPGRRDDIFRFVHSLPDGRKCRVRTHLRPEFSLVKSNVQAEGVVNPFGRLSPEVNSLVVSGKVIPMSDFLPPDKPKWEFTTESAEWRCANAEKGYLIMVSHDWDDDAAGGSNPAVTTEEELSKIKLLLLSSCCSLSELPAGSIKPGAEATTKILFPTEHSRTFLDDPDFQSGGGAGATCSFCQDQKRKRDVWGLLLYPADSQGRHYRVGIFYSRAQHGGSEVFNEAQTCEVELM
ncbi:hypothetical protein QC762_311340 [Podospora pseudocomata]|uniref:Heterokaryon incompatibility domain-containing protein n=1 Tax=Podospora pseudocomata TaxID=2093779 RepID=A0ABR0GL61_9PEZI|nr:hypothetical protein QC762_311340 [Podospora pseudocomata]